MSVSTSNSPKKKIAILATFPLEWLEQTGERRAGVSQFWLLSLAEAFSQQTDYEIHWCVFKTRAAARTLTYNGQYFHIIPSISHAFNAAAYYLQARYTMRRLLKRINPSLVHAWGTEGYYGICGQEFSGPRLLSIQGILNACLPYAPGSRYIKKQAKWEKSSISAYHLITAESPWAREKVRELVPDAPVIQWEYAVDSQFCHVKRTLSKTPEVLMVCGNFGYKNVQTAIEAFASPLLSHVKLRIAGVSPYAYPNASPNVELLGNVLHTELPQLMARAWCLLHTSLVDTGPTAAKEARMVGLPLIISSHCGAQQYVEEGKSGHIIAPHDIQAIIRSVLDVTESAEKALSMGAHGYEECCRALSQENMISRLMAIYHQLLED